MLNLDTLVLIHALCGNLRYEERTLLVDHRWGVAAIVLWEMAKLAQIGRISLDLAHPLVETILASIHIWPLDLEVAQVSTQLDFRADPADELIAATSIVHGVPLLTRDERIRQSKMVPLA